MSNHLMTDVGENLEYVKTIVNNTIELKKIEAAETASSVVSVSILGLLIGAISMFIFAMLLIFFTLLIAQSVGSLSTALLIMSGCLTVLILIIYGLRKALIVKPITKIIYSSIIGTD